MTSQRRRKRAAQQQGLTAAELQLTELLREVLDALRWAQVLGWGNQYLLQEHLRVPAEERDRVMRAAATTVERDGQLQQWQQRLADLEAKLAAIDAAMRDGRGSDVRGSDVRGGDVASGQGGETAPGAEAADGA